MYIFAQIEASTVKMKTRLLDLISWFVRDNRSIPFPLLSCISRNFV